MAWLMTVIHVPSGTIGIVNGAAVRAERSAAVRLVGTDIVRPIGITARRGEPVIIRGIDRPASPAIPVRPGPITGIHSVPAAVSGVVSVGEAAAETVQFVSEGTGSVPGDGPRRQKKDCCKTSGERRCVKESFHDMSLSDEMQWIGSPFVSQ